MTAGAALEARGVRREFGGGAGVHGVDLRVEPGEIHALVGLNGAGKTTLMRLLLGMLRPDDGEVLLGGVPLPEVAARAWAGVGHLVETPPTYPELTARANLELAARLHAVPRRAVSATVAAVLDELGLDRYASVRARRLSLGNRQRVGLAAALQHSPGVVVLDEPGNGLDPSGVLLLRSALRRRADAGAGILVSSHHLDEVARVADRISVMNAGRIIGAMAPGGHDPERAFFELVLADDAERAS
ncbi:ABC transporter ATP-binding protein [Agromyces sp. SYSU T00194]|uniref:ABC transporter ATP-binding protein n=1 Tax=Agromyces chitinivorans TaxID=3158560 RepID=UPI003397276F